MEPNGSLGHKKVMDGRGRTRADAVPKIYTYREGYGQLKVFRTDLQITSKSLMNY